MRACHRRGFAYVQVNGLSAYVLCYSKCYQEANAFIKVLTVWSLTFLMRT